MPSPRHEQALAYARAGIPVFPVQVGDKRPLPLSKGFHDATTDENTINGWWEFADYNLALCPEDAGWCVVDLDGQEGIDAWQSLAASYGSPTTYTVRTPSGGVHLYFRGSLPPSARKLGLGIDTRGRGSYVVVPPSIVNGVSYAIREDVDPIELPAWIEEHVSSVAERKTAEGDYDEDSPARLEEAKRRIRLELHYNGEPQIGAGSDDRSYKLVARLRDIGLSDPTIIDMLEALWAPHFDRSWIETKVTNAEKYGQNDRGSVHVRSPEEANASLLSYCHPAASTKLETPAETPQAEFGSASQSAPDFARSFNAIRSAEYPPVEWVWQDRLLKGMANLYTGDAGAGKTTLAENIAVACACRVGSFLGADTDTLPVLLLVGEDAEGQVRDNLRDIARDLGVLNHPGMADIHIRSTLTHEPAAGPWLAKIDGMAVDWCLPFAEELAQFICTLDRPSLIVIDPLAEFVQFDNLDPIACRLLGTQFCRMISRFGVGGHTVLVNDHPSKASMASGAHYAGSTQLKAAFALFATLLKGEWSGSNTRQRELTLSVQKARYAPESEVTFFRTALSPLFVQDGAPGERKEDHMRRVYAHVIERLDRGLPTQRDDRGKVYPASEVARALDMAPSDVRRTFSALIAEGWLVYREKDSSGSGYECAHFERGNKVPMPPQREQY